MNDYLSIIKTVNNLFIFTDTHLWNLLQAEVFAPKVLLDYTSFAGGEPAWLTADEIVSNWKGFMPGFKSTHHQIGNCQVTINGAIASVFCYGTASHYLPNPGGKDVWTVVGSYDFELVQTADRWRVKKMKFNFKYQDGNLDLPRLATAAMQEK